MLKCFGSYIFGFVFIQLFNHIIIGAPALVIVIDLFFVCLLTCIHPNVVNIWAILGVISYFFIILGGCFWIHLTR